MMSIKKFGNEIRILLLERMDGVKDIMVNQRYKNNSVSRISLFFSDARSNMAPIIDLEGFYKKYESGEDIDTITEQIIDCYETARMENRMDVSFIYDWEQVKSKVVFKLINKERNGNLLNGLPYQEVLDLAMVFYLTLYDGKATMLIENKHMKLWNVEVEELESIALENTPRIFPARFCPLDEVFEEITGGEMEKGGKLHIVTNNTKMLGAGVILYPKMLEKIAEWFQTDFYIIPSSIHEMLIWPRDEETEKDVENFTEIIHVINTTQLEPEEILGDGVYLYSMKNGKLMLSCV